MRILHRNGIFAAVNTIEEKPALQKAGFTWHRGEECAFGSRSCYACKAGLKRAWWTRRHEAAARLSAYADEDAKRALAEHLHAVEMSRATDSEIEIPCPKGLAFYGYQKAGIEYMARREGTLLGDQQGLGKTPMCIGVINLDQSIKNVLVIAPARLRINWQREARRWLVPDGRKWLIHIVDEDAPIPSSANLVIIHYNRITIGHRRCGGPCGGEKRKPLPCSKCNGTGNGEREPLLCDLCQGKKFMFCKICKGRGRTPASNIKIVDSIVKRKWDLIIADECFPYDTHVLTDRGQILIGEIVENKLPVRVLCYDSSHNAFAWRKIKNWIARPLLKKLVRISHENGQLTCTADHKIWCHSKSKYVEAGQLEAGDLLLVLPSQAMQAMQKECSEREISSLSSRVKRVEVLEQAGHQGDQTVYDIEVEEHHNYLAEGVLVSNCHFLKNLKAKRTRAVLGDPFKKRPGLIDLARKKLFLTGTPIPNRPYEIWPIASALAPDAFGSFKQFARRYCAGREEWVSKTKQVFKMDGATHLEELQEKLRSTCLIRRLKEDVLKDLPPKRRQIIELPASDEAKKLITEELDLWEKKFGNEMALAEAAMEIEGGYEAAVEKLKYIQSVAFMEMARIRKQVAIVKIPAVIEHLEGLFEEGVDKILCFAHHREVIERLQQHFNDKAVSVYGGTNMKASQAAIDDFQDLKSKVKLFIGGITAIGFGTTLTASSNVVFAELDWTPGNISQAEDRTHRIGQVNSVLVQHLVLNGSLDARMAQMIVEKQDIADRALDKDTAVSVGGAHRPRPVIELPVDPVPVWKKIALKEALIILAQRRDPATQEGHGFSQFDNSIGQSLATSKKMLSDRQAHLGMRLVTKYRRQLSLSSPPLAKQLGIFEEPQLKTSTHRRASPLANVYGHKQLRLLEQLIPPKITP